MDNFAQVAALVAIVSSAVSYGTDVFAAIALRPALAQVDDAALTAVMGNIHRYADRRMPVPSFIGIIASAAAAVLAAIAGNTPVAAFSGAAFILWIVWIALYQRISAPINHTLSAAAGRYETPTNARALQEKWDSIIALRATVQGAIVIALGVALVVS